MKNRFMTVLMTGLVAGSMLSSSVLAQDAPVAGHPRVNEIDQRLENQQKRIDNGVKDGQLTAGQVAHDENRDAKVSQELSKDEAKHGGHITKAEQKKMNRQLNKNSKKIHHQRKKGEERKQVAQ
jgi:hypothetical protein